MKMWYLEKDVKVVDTKAKATRMVVSTQKKYCTYYTHRYVRIFVFSYVMNVAWKYVLSWVSNTNMKVSTKLKPFLKMLTYYNLMQAYPDLQLTLEFICHKVVSVSLMGNCIWVNSSTQMVGMLPVEIDILCKWKDKCSWTFVMCTMASTIVCYTCWNTF